jgi:hypothetical protein
MVANSPLPVTSRRLFVVAAGLFLSGCSTLAPDRPPRCKGPRRPGNPHGSLLDPVAAPGAPPGAPSHGVGGCGARS